MGGLFTIISMGESPIGGYFSNFETMVVMSGLKSNVKGDYMKHNTYPCQIIFFCVLRWS